MSNNFTVKLCMYGVFRQFIQQDHIEIKLQEPCTLKKFKQLIYQYIQQQCDTFQDEQLVQISAIATEQEILPDSACINTACCLSILPPVCGG